MKINSLLLVISVFVLGYSFGMPKHVDTEAIAKVSHQIKMEEAKLQRMEMNQASSIKIELQKGIIARLERDKRILEEGGSIMN